MLDHHDCPAGPRSLGSVPPALLETAGISLPAARRNYQATSPPEAIEDIPSISVENPLEDGTTCIWQAKVIRESTEDPARK